MKIRDSAKSAMAQSMLADMAVGTSGLPALELLTAPMPSDIGEAITATSLLRIDLADGIGTSAGGVITFGSIPATNGETPGKIGWARIIDKNGDDALHLTAGLAGSGADVIVSEENIESGSPVTVSLASISVGG